MSTKFFVIFLVACLLFSGMALAVQGENANDSRGSGSGDVGPDDKGTDIMDDKGLGDVNRTQSQDQDKNMTQSQDRDKDQTQSQDRDKDQTQDRNMTQSMDQDRNQTQDKIQSKDRDQTQDRLQILDQVKNRTAEHKMLLDKQLQNVSNADKLKVFQNQNQVREAVMALLTLREAGNLSGGIGQNISAIAVDFNNSVRNTIRAEEAIRSRDGFTRFLFGGDENAAAALQAELNQNRVRIMQLEQLRLMLDSEYQPFVEEQIRLMQEEQTRLQELIQKEQQDKGLLGWLFK